MKRSTAIRHLVEVANEATEIEKLQRPAFDLGLEELWVAGELLDGNAAPDFGTVVGMLDVAPQELPWMALHPSGEWVFDRLRLGKRPLIGYYRPMAWPAWNARHRGVVRFWSATDGRDVEVIEQLQTGTVVVSEAATDNEVRNQLLEERAVGEAHLRRIVDTYWEGDWRREHRGQRAEDMLWRASAGLIEIDDALASLAR